MAVGTTDTFVSTRDEIIADALSKLGVIGPGEDATGTPRTHAARRLDAIVKELDSEGQFLWRMSRLTVTTTASTATVTISALAVDIDEPIRFTKSGATVGVPLSPMTRDEYMALPDRTITADTPTRYYIEKSLSGGRASIALYLYPEPEDTGDTVEYVAALRAKDFNDGSTNPDFPSSWTRCLGFMLTADLAPDYKQPGLVKVFRDIYEPLLERLLGADNEHQGLFLVPFGGAY
jgi:hypothetical protein